MFEMEEQYYLLKYISVNINNYLLCKMKITDSRKEKV